MGLDGQIDSFGLKRLCCSGTAYAPAVFLACVPGNGHRFGFGTTGITGSNDLDKLLDVSLIRSFTSRRRPLSRNSPLVFVTQAFLLRSFKRISLDQQTLTLVSSPGSAEPHDYRGQFGVLAAPAGQCHISAWQKNQMVQIRAFEAQRL